MLDSQQRVQSDESDSIVDDDQPSGAATSAPELAVLFVDHEDGYIGNTADYLGCKLTAAPVDKLCRGTLSTLFSEVKERIGSFESEYRDEGRPIFVQFIVIDLRAPGAPMGGLRLLRDIKTDAFTQCRDVYVITTKSISEEERRQLRAAGARDVWILGGTTKVWEAAVFVKQRLGLP